MVAYQNVTLDYEHLSPLRKMYRMRKRQDGNWEGEGEYIVSYIILMTIMAGVLPPTLRSKYQAEKLPVFRPNCPLYHHTPHLKS